MAAPTFIAAYNSTYNAPAASKSVTVTTQAGDTLVVYGGGDTDGTTPLTINTPTGNGVSLALQQSIVITNNASAFIWYGVDNSGGTNWSLTATASSTNPDWGFTCVVIRGAGGLGDSAAITGTGTPSLPITTRRANSIIVVFNNDWALAAGSRTWIALNGITPSSGNGLEITYVAGTSMIDYGAYYSDAGAPSAAIVGLSAPASQSYYTVGLEVMGRIAPTAVTRAVTNIGPTTATGNGIIMEDGGTAITERGICWNTSPNPTTSNSKATAAGTLGSYSASMTGLSSNTVYYVRAYAVNAIGTSYGENVQFREYPVSLAWQRV